MEAAMVTDRRGIVVQMKEEIIVTAIRDRVIEIGMTYGVTVLITITTGIIIGIIIVEMDRIPAIIGVPAGTLRDIFFPVWQPMPSGYHSAMDIIIIPMVVITDRTMADIP